MIYPLIKIDNPTLRQESVKLDQKDENLLNIIQDLTDNLAFYEGLGLSAIQLGIPKQIFIAQIEGKNRLFINTEILEKSSDFEIEMEGCLSLLTIFIPVKRPRQIKVKYFTENFEEKIETFEGLWARLVLHEYEHGQGILFNDGISQTQKEVLQQKIKKLKRNGKYNIDEKVINLMRQEIESKTDKSEAIVI